ncbi:MAG: hypothetical protein AB8H86_08285 [Polyangiales bacterium]
MTDEANDPHDPLEAEFFEGASPAPAPIDDEAASRLERKLRVTGHVADAAGGAVRFATFGMAAQIVLLLSSVA